MAGHQERLHTFLKKAPNSLKCHQGLLKSDTFAGKSSKLTSMCIENGLIVSPYRKIIAS